MSWLGKLFKKKETPKATTSTNTVNKPIIAKPINTTNKIELVSNGGELNPAIIIGEIKKKTPEYYKNIYVILDNGHGVDTAGKRSPDGRLREYAWAREIVKRIKAELDSLGIESTILVPEEKDIPLAERVKRANAIHTKEHSKGKVVILLSIHCNAAGNGEWKNARGWSAWTSRGITKSDDVANCLYEAAHEILDPKGIKIREDMSDGDPDWESNFYIIYKSSMPAVLIENFFQDNREDVKYLLSEEGKTDCVNIHVLGIKKYLDMLYK